MIKYLLILIISWIAIKGNSQELTGQIFNSENENPVSFVNIGVLGENIGTASDVDGKFKLTIDSTHFSDSLRISCIGYYSKSYSIEELVDKSSNHTILKLNLDPREYQIKEVIVNAKKAKVISLGNPIQDNNRCRLRTDSELGSEMGLVIRLPKKDKIYLLKDFTFNLADHDFETEVRVNIYSIGNSMPSENILNESIFIKIPSNEDIMTIDLLKYNLQIDQDFFISIEHFKKNPDMSKRLKYNCVLAKDSKTGCYFRKVSQGDWREVDNVGVQFKISAYVQ
ncbi:MAG: carboxypeptidase-like regulatory domain-containing protein [Bacteroidales bacterium]|nr:carboxypeptidase-like regulatory domain-containing protein [Bacteroidales bacterium]